jgi:hypothetical protein
MQLTLFFIGWISFWLFCLCAVILSDLGFLVTLILGGIACLILFFTFSWLVMAAYCWLVNSAIRDVVNIADDERRRRR